MIFESGLAWRLGDASHPLRTQIPYKEAHCLVDPSIHLEHQTLFAHAPSSCQTPPRSPVAATVYIVNPQGFAFFFSAVSLLFSIQASSDVIV